MSPHIKTRVLLPGHLWPGILIPNNQAGFSHLYAYRAKARGGVCFVFSGLKAGATEIPTTSRFPGINSKPSTVQKMSNKLADQTSPYLLQHANNPVDWYPWGEEARSKAKSENKLIIVSIGYAACHWCHVMERESFEDEEVAQLMNAHFVSIKIDREERPDIDQIYMDAVQLMRQQGGWPLNVVTLPDGRPVFGGTYFRKDHWMQVLNQLAELYQNNPARALSYADNLVETMQQMGGIGKMEQKVAFNREDLFTIKSVWKEQIDYKWGGRLTRNNKFPLPMNNLLLLRLCELWGDEELQTAADVTLEKMAFGGIYDQLGGGFARYSVDPYWKVPHFEKMLYDNGQLVSTYAEAWQQKPTEIYKQVVYQTLEFIQREMTSPEGGFYASLDADSEGVEGKFYTWKYEELEDLLGEDARLFADFYNAHPTGNWEGTNILFLLETESDFAKRWKLDEAEFKAKMAKGREILFEAREKRIRPGLDDKILTSWNALMLKGCADAYRVFGEKQFLDMALKNARFLRKNLTDGGKLFRNYKEGKRTINAFLDDYAFLIEAYMALYQLTFDESWLRWADEHVQYVQQHFFDEETGMFFYTSDEDPVLIKRKLETQDDVIPASNASLAHSLLDLSLLMDKPAYHECADQMLQNMRPNALNHPAWHAKWGQLILKHVFPHYEVAIMGPEAMEYRMELEKHYYPNRIFAGGTQESQLPVLLNRWTSQTTIYVCEGKSCKLPVRTVAEATEQLHI